jgi:hypothetical protein
MREPHTKSPLERSTLEAYGGAVLGILGAIVTAWWAKSILLACAAGLLVHAILRSNLTIHWSLWRKAVGVIGVLSILCLIGGNPILEDFQRQNPGMFSENHPKEPLKTSLPVAPSAPAQTSVPLRSILGDLIYVCDVPVPSPTSFDTMLFQQKLDYFAQTLKIYGDAVGAKFTVQTIEGGVRINMDAAPGGPRAAIGSPFTKGAVEVRRVGNVEMVNVKIEMPEVFKILPVEATDPQVVGLTNGIHRLLSFRDGTCHLV